MCECDYVDIFVFSSNINICTMSTSYINVHSWCEDTPTLTSSSHTSNGVRKMICRFYNMLFVFLFGLFSFHACRPRERQQGPNNEWPFSRSVVRPGDPPRRTGIISNTLAGFRKLYSRLSEFTLAFL